MRDSGNSWRRISKEMGKTTVRRIYHEAAAAGRMMSDKAPSRPSVNTLEDAVVAKHSPRLLYGFGRDGWLCPSSRKQAANVLS
jgi:hypothetical protein